MSSVALEPLRIEGRICPRTRFDEGGRYLVFPNRSFSAFSSVQESGCGTAATLPASVRMATGYSTRPPPGAL